MNDANRDIEGWLLTCWYEMTAEADSVGQRALSRDHHAAYQCLACELELLDFRTYFDK